MSAPSEHLERALAYGPGHPWYYVLGGPVLGPASIRRNVIARGYRGCSVRAIDEADAKKEPQRSEALRKLRAQVLCDLRNSLLRYRKLACQYHGERRQPQLDERACSDLHMALSLKHNHIYNDIAHLVVLDDLLKQQGDLFG